MIICLARSVCRIFMNRAIFPVKADLRAIRQLFPAKTVAYNLQLITTRLRCRSVNRCLEAFPSRVSISLLKVIYLTFQ